ncbi:MAG: ATP-binding protein [Proteobacteria bacterium]|nr:ATP-binding protein [Cystobacterineae bacterium]MCL2258217.1 ATP-binding protein [Cystobacterineae bacterium]MCL2315439.1 ATP-binding protein [Pseudomonadota bacterium]
MNDNSDEVQRLREQLKKSQTQIDELTHRLERYLTSIEAHFFSGFSDIAIGALLVNFEQKIVFANAAASTMLAKPIEQLTGQVVTSLFPSLHAFVQNLIVGKSNKGHTEVLMRDENLSAVWLAIWASNIHEFMADEPYLLLMVENITELKQAEERARRISSEKSIRRRLAFLAELSSAISSSLEQSTIIDRLTRLSIPELGGFCMFELFGHAQTFERVACASISQVLEAQLANSQFHQTPAWQQLLKTTLDAGYTCHIRSNGKFWEETWNKRQHDFGEPVPANSLLISPILIDNDYLGCIVFGKTAQEEHSEGDFALAEELSRRAVLAFDNARLYQQAKGANKLKDDFLAIVSHELRTPLVPILGWAQLLKSNLDNLPTLSKGLDVIERNARMLTQLIDDLLDVSRSIAGKLSLEFRPTSFQEIVSNVVEGHRLSASNQNISIHCMASGKLPLVMGDALRLQQVVSNLMSNAIKFSHPGGEIHISLKLEGRNLALKVVDNGVGIEPGFLAHLFERFRQGESASTRKHDGLGLGLSIAQSLVETHHGSIEAQSEGVGKGTTMIVRLPAIL